LKNIQDLLYTPKKPEKKIHNVSDFEKQVGRKDMFLQRKESWKEELKAKKLLALWEE